MSSQSLRRAGFVLVAASVVVLVGVSSGGANNQPLIVGQENLSTITTSLRTLFDGPAFYVSNACGTPIPHHPCGAAGVYGLDQSTEGAGVGVKGETSSPDGVGVSGLNTSTKNGFGVWGYGYNGVGGSSSGDFGTGVSGSAAGNGSAGVSGRASGASSVGVSGTASAPPGATAYGVYGSATAPAYAGYFKGDVHGTSTISAPSMKFIIDDPLNPGRYFVHSAVGSAEQLNVYTGNVTTGGKGFATIELPAWFEALNKDFRYQLTIIGRRGWKARVVKGINHSQFTIQSDVANVRVSWQVTAVRHDSYANAHPIRYVEQEKPASERANYKPGAVLRAEVSGGPLPKLP